MELGPLAEHLQRRFELPWVQVGRSSGFRGAQGRGQRLTTWGGTMRPSSALEGM